MDNIGNASTEGSDLLEKALSDLGHLDGALSDDGDNVDFGCVFDDEVTVCVVVHAIRAQDGCDGLNGFVEEIRFVRFVN